jgi:ribosomal protein S18 acetylase RimI-like enzyme
LCGEGETFLYALAVDPEYRRKKVGTALINAIRKEMKKFDSSIIQLLVYRGNTGALAFYDTFGAIKYSPQGYMKIGIPVEEIGG